MTCEWPVNIWKHAPHPPLSVKCRLKQHWDSISPQSPRKQIHAGEDGGKESYTLPVSKLVHPLWKSVWRVLGKQEIELTQDPATLLLGIHPKASKATHPTDPFTPVYCAAIRNRQVKGLAWVSANRCRNLVCMHNWVLDIKKPQLYCF